MDSSPCPEILVRRGREEQKERKSKKEKTGRERYNTCKED
jgi:hypothetical protein